MIVMPVRSHANNVRSAAKKIRGSDEAMGRARIFCGRPERRQEAGEELSEWAAWAVNLVRLNPPLVPSSPRHVPAPLVRPRPS